MSPLRFCAGTHIKVRVVYILLEFNQYHGIIDSCNHDMPKMWVYFNFFKSFENISVNSNKQDSQGLSLNILYRSQNYAQAVPKIVYFTITTMRFTSYKQDLIFFIA